MRGDPDPFAHHPELRELIADPLRSYFRDFTTAALAAKMREMGLPGGWWHPEEEREACRLRALADRPGGDLWVFAYGSLMWDPALRFAEVRRALVPGYARRFILKDVYGGRGTFEAPGLMAALDGADGHESGSCEGLVFRIAGEHVEEETRILWQRERIGPCYTPTFVEARIGDTAVPVLAFLADHESILIDTGLTHEEQIRFLATGTGFMGTSLDYLRNIDRKFRALGIHDEEIVTLLRDTEAYLAARLEAEGRDRSTA